MGGHAEAYLKNILPLAQKFHVYAIDLVGHGLTDKPEIDYTIPDFVDHVSRFLDGAGIGRAHIQGESLGGWISAWLTIEHPDQVLSLTLNTSAGLKLTEQPPEAEARAVERLRNLTREAVAEPTRESVRRRLEWLFLKPEEQVTDELVEIRYQIYRRPDTQHAMKKIVEQMTGDGRKKYVLTAEQLRRIHTPTLILWSEHNPTTPWQVAERAHQIIAGSRFHVIKECGHWPQWEKADEFNSRMTDFLCAVPA
jgi:pimeloyl-ACP methyl ester carboxylesterase